MNLNLEFTDPIQWNQDDEYSINDVVFNGTDAYTAIDYVPSGTLLTNTAYWKKTGKFIRTQNLDNGAVTTEKIATNAVTTGKLAGKVVTTAKIDDAAVTADKLSDDALDDAIAMSGQGENVATDNSSYLASLTVDGKAVQNGTPTPSNPVDVQVVQGINLLPNTATTKTVSNVTITVNPDKSITTNGTASAQIDTVIGTMTLTGGSYFLSGCPSGGSWSGYALQFTDNPVTTNQGIDSGNGVSATVTSGNYLVRLHIASGQNVSNLVFRPQLEAGSTATPYTPYGSIGLKVGSTITPINLQGNVLASLPDGTKDVLTVDSVGHCVLEKHIGEITLNGTTGKSVGTVWTASNYPMFGTTAIDTLAVSTSTGGLSNMFAYSNPDAMWGGGSTYAGYFSIASGGNSLRFRLLDSSITTVADVNTWLASNAPTFNYPLATPTTIDLGYIDMPTIPDGSTISITAQVTPTISASWWTRGAAAVPEALDDLDDSVISKLEPRIDDIASSIAVVENGETSSANYSVNDFIMRFDKLYQVTSAIATGESFVVDTNIEEKTVIEAIIAMIENM